MMPPDRSPPPPATSTPEPGRGEPTVTPPATCTGTPVPGPRRLVRLSPEQLAATVSAALNGRASAGRPLPALPSSLAVGLSPVTSNRYSTYAGANSLNDNEVRESMQSSAQIAAALVAKVKATAGTCFGAQASADCIGMLLSQKGEILFHRPLAAEELARYRGLYTSNVAVLGPDEALALVFQALLLAPQALFRTELGTGAGPFALTPFEIASAIAFTLTDAPPDQELWAAARSGTLDVAGVEGQIERLLRTAPELPPFRRFFREYFEYEGVTAVFKSTPGYDREALLAQTDAMVADVLAMNLRQGLLRALLTSHVGFVDKTTAPLYGVAPPASLQRVTFPAAERLGLLTQPAFLAAFSEMDHSLPVRRGRFVNEKLLCQPVPEAPIGTIPPLPELGPDATMKERLSLHRRDPACAVCHNLLDPVGLAFEMYDDAGRRRTTPVDTSGKLAGSIDRDGPFADGLEMIDRIAGSKGAERCFVTNGFRYWLGRDDRPEDDCVVADAQAAYAGSNRDYVALIQTLFTSSVFLNRN